MKAADRQFLDHEYLDLAPPGTPATQHKVADGQAADGRAADRNGAERQGTDRKCAGGYRTG